MRERRSDPSVRDLAVVPLRRAMGVLAVVVALVGGCVQADGGDDEPPPGLQVRRACAAVQDAADALVVVVAAGPVDLDGPLWTAYAGAVERAGPLANRSGDTDLGVAVLRWREAVAARTAAAGDPAGFRAAGLTEARSLRSARQRCSELGAPVRATRGD